MPFDEEEIVVKHPAQGVIIITKRHGGGQAAFGSDNLHSETVGICIKEASLTRRLSSDFIMGEKKIVELRMTAAQWAEMISSFGNGSGTPVTFDYRADLPEKQVPAYVLPESEMTKHTGEMHQTIKDGMQALRDLRKRLMESLAKPTITKGERQAMIHDIDKAERELVMNTKFVVDSFEETVEKRMSVARIEIEAHAHNRVVELGLDAVQKAVSTSRYDPRAIGDEGF